MSEKAVSKSAHMAVRHICVEDRGKWDALIEKEPSFALLQSWDWGRFKEELGWKVCRIGLEENGQLVAGAQLLIKPLPLGMSMAYLPRGPVGTWASAGAMECLLPTLAQVAREHGAAFLKIEPPTRKAAGVIEQLEGFGFRPSRVSNQPQATIILDLTPGEVGVLQQMRKKTRQYIHRAEREGITVRPGGAGDLPAYYDLLRLTSKREHFAARTLKYYESEWATLSAGGNGALLLAYHQDRLVGARVAYRFGSHAAEFHAGSIPAAGLHTNYLLVWEAIRWAISKGCSTYDLWGIPDELSEADDEQQPEAGGHEGGLWGVYQFKRGFSRNVVSYIGAYDYIIAPRHYQLVNSRLFNGKWWERIAALLDLLEFEPSRAKLRDSGEEK